MVKKVRYPLAFATVCANDIVALLAPACERIEIAGSIRRRETYVGDVEIVCIPRLEWMAQGNMFGSANEPVIVRNELNSLCNRLLAAGKLSKRGGWGDRLKLARYRTSDGGEIPLDLFAVLPPAQWGAILTIRTGPADFSRLLVTADRSGGAMPSFMRQSEGRLQRWTGGDIEDVETPEEEDYFAALGLPWMPPEQRNEAFLKWELERVVPRTATA